MHNNTNLTAMTGTALALGIMMTIGGTASTLNAQLSSEGSTALPHASQGTMMLSASHGAAPVVIPQVAYPEAQLVLGMTLILFGFILALALKRSERNDERPVRICIKTPEAVMAPRRMSRKRKVYWMQVSL